MSDECLFELFSRVKARLFTSGVSLFVSKEPYRFDAVYIGFGVEGF